MATVIKQLLSRTLFSTDGVTTVWDFSFSGGYIDPSHVKAYTETPLGARTDRTVTLTGPYQATITPALPAGDILVIYRDTPKNAPLVDFTDESGFSETSLDTNAKQAVFIAAETIDVVNTTALDIAVDAADRALASADSAAISAASAAADAEATASLAGNVAANSANIATVSTNIASVNSVAAQIVSVNTVASISGSVTAVAGNAANINAVNDNAANINAAVANAAAINAAPAQAAAAAASAVAASDSAASSANSEAAASSSADIALDAAADADLIILSGLGFTNSTAYDFGAVSDPSVLFPTDFGAL
jgi:hypothetical protein